MTWHTHLKITQPKKNYPNPNKKNPTQIKINPPHSNQIKSQQANYRFLSKNNISRLVIGLVIGFPAEAELLLQYSSAGGGKTFPARRCILIAAPVICWTLLL